MKAWRRVVGVYVVLNLLSSFVAAPVLAVPLKARSKIEKKKDTRPVDRRKIQSDCLDAWDLALQDVKRESIGGGNMTGGLFGGCLLGLIGTLVAVGSAKGDAPPPCD